jgi:2-phospho-L-lactate guanylyltransferase (CobY/MobA/RfbA family)
MTDNNSKTDVVILAGAPAGVELSPEDGSISRGMVDVAGKTMIQRVVDALRGSQSIGRIAAVGHVQADGIDIVIEPGQDLVTNMKAGADALQTQANVLIVCSDIPLLTSEAVDDFLARAGKLGVDLAIPIITKTSCDGKYPGMARTYLATADGTFTAGNIMLMSPGFLGNNWNAVAEAYAARKQVGKLARMIGMGVLARVLLAKLVPSVLKVSMLEGAVERMLGAKVAAIVSDYPEIGEDVDKPSDLEAVRRVLYLR